MEEFTLTIEQLLELIHNHRVKDIRALFVSEPAVDLAEVVNEIESSEDLLFLFRTVKSEYTAELFSFLDSDQQEKLIRIFTDKQLMELIENSYTDDLVDSLEELPANLVKKVLSVADKETREEINRLLNYKEHTAGSIMTTEYVELKAGISVEEALAKIRRIGKEAITIYTTFIIDNKRNLVGALYLDELLFAKPDQLIDEIMNEDYLTVNVNDDQEEVANTFRRYDKEVIPVLNDDNRMIGVITIDDIIDVITEEDSEDMAKMAAVAPLETAYKNTGVWQLAKKCFPWLMILLVLGVFSSVILNRFEAKLSSLVILTAFIPILMDTGGNSGTQSATLIIRALALKEFTAKDFLRIVWKEFRIALIVGSIVGSFAFLWVFIEISTGILAYNTGFAMWSAGWFAGLAKLAGLVAMTLFIAIIISKVVGASLPLIAVALKLDPALMAAPLLTTIVDICSLLVYFVLSIAMFNLV